MGLLMVNLGRRKKGIRIRKVKNNKKKLGNLEVGWTLSKQLLDYHFMV